MPNTFLDGARGSISVVPRNLIMRSTLKLIDEGGWLALRLGFGLDMHTLSRTMARLKIGVQVTVRQGGATQVTCPYPPPITPASPIRARIRVSYKLPKPNLAPSPT